MPHRSLPLSLLVALAACAPLDPGERRCRDSSECPLGMACVPPAPDAPSVCRFGPAGGTGADGGGQTDGGDRGDAGSPPGGDGGTPPPAGTAPTYCRDVKPVLDQYCASCHRSPPAGGAPATFRLDTYGEEGGVPGAASRAARIKARAVEQRTMPPAGAPQPSDAERVLLGQWVDAGAPECGDVPTDGGTPPPPQVPEQVRFTQHVQPILDTFCVRCHGGSDPEDPEGDLLLTAGSSHAQLMDRADCDRDLLRVVPGAPERSLLWMVLVDHPASCAPPMPNDTPGLKVVSEVDFLTLERWIQQGAKND